MARLAHCRRAPQGNRSAAPPAPARGGSGCARGTSNPDLPSRTISGIAQQSPRDARQPVSPSPRRTRAPTRRTSTGARTPMRRGTALTAARSSSADRGTRPRRPKPGAGSRLGPTIAKLCARRTSAATVRQASSRILPPLGSNGLPTNSARGRAVVLIAYRGLELGWRRRRSRAPDREGSRNRRSPTRGRTR